MDAYWDTSCVLKLYCLEADSAEYVRRIEIAAEPLVSSVLLSSELAFAFHQKELRGEISVGSADLLCKKFAGDVLAGRFTLIPFGGDVQREARRIAGLCYRGPTPIPLRTLDGLHLASARLAGCKAIFTTDSRMRSAAALVGLAIAS